MQKERDISILEMGLEEMKMGKEELMKKLKTRLEKLWRWNI